MEIVTIVISIISITITIINQYQIIKDKDPQLLFKLTTINNQLFLLVKNTGKTAAKNIKISIDKINNNVDNNKMEDIIFKNTFELASGEFIQGMVAYSYDTISDRAFPFIDITVSYQKESIFNKKVEYKRQVFFIASSEDKIFVDTGLNLITIEDEIIQIHKALLRMANYFDGCEIAPFDDLNIVSKNHFSSDLLNSTKGKKSKIKNRKKCIEERIRQLYMTEKELEEFVLKLLVQSSVKFTDEQKEVLKYIVNEIYKINK